ncbi:orotidine-5'-phosphate decarboxylase [Candidatus Peregrinibacteria bacterium]|nr:MAG: orotidine-5'-phosphate decarboxylase [Candidatus Peregrinibacteria bacterium]
MHFADALVRSIKAKESALCVGLDPQVSKLPAFLLKRAVEEHGQTVEAAAEAYLAFNKGIIDAVKDLVPAVKPQLAFYEELGFHGIRAFEETCRYAQAPGLLVIADGKRNDIGSTAEAYARAFFGGEILGETRETHVDALTVNGYLGFDGISPFLGSCAKGKGIFVLVRTSNPSSGDVQDRVTADENMSMAELMGHFVESWGSDLEGEEGYSSVGAVVGATHPVQAEKLRAIMPRNFFLVPGYGAQGGTAQDIAPCFNNDGLGALIVNARGIIYAFAEGGLANGENFAEAARTATLRMKEDVNRVR